MAKKVVLKKHRGKGVLVWLAGLIYRHTWPILLSLTALTIAFGNYALKLEQQTTLKDLLPDDNKVVTQFEETVRDFNMVDRVVLAIRCKPENLEYAQVIADLFVDEVRNDPEFSSYLKYMNGNIFDQIEQTNYYEYLQYLTRFLPADKLEQLAARLTPEGIRQRVEQNYRDLESGIAAKTLIEKDPLALLDLAASYRDQITGNYSLDVSDGYLVSKDHELLLVLGKPTRPPEEVDFSVALTQFLEAKVDAACIAFEEEEGILAKDVAELGLTGAHPITAHENRTIKSDVVSMFVTSFFMVLALFIVAYHRPMAVVYVGIPLLSAEIWTLGIGYFLFGRLNLLTATFSAVIVGLGIDYAIHIFSRYLDEKSAGKDALAAMELSLGETGIGTLTGGATTALAFLAMGFNNFRGLIEFAVIAAVGIAMCLFQMFVFLPALLFLRDRFRTHKATPVRAQRDFKVEKLISACLRYRKEVLGAIVITTLWFGWEAIHLSFNADLRSVRAQSNPAINLQSQITSKVGGSLRSLTFVIEAPSEEALYGAHEQLTQKLDQLIEHGELVRYDTALSFLRPPADQLANIEYIKGLGLDQAPIAEVFESSMKEMGFRFTDDCREYISYVVLGVQAKDPIPIRELLNSRGEAVVGQFVHATEHKYKAVAHVYPSRGLWVKDATNTLIKNVIDSVDMGPDGDFYVTGIQTIADEIKTLVQLSFEVTSVLAVLFVFGVLAFHFRKIVLVCLTLVPLLVSVIWMLGTMQLFGIHINLLNFVATPIIIGIGIDDGVHIVEKYLHRKSQPLGQLIASCAKAVTLTSLTTITGFSSLFMAKYAGFKSLGISAILGVFYCWLASVVLLPILMETFKPKFARH
ncbi:MAG: MMPL family transporter [Acidobacteria bacterium]|nr:MMPL family transporter [Acidobacteriota bacterium]